MKRRFAAVLLALVLPAGAICQQGSNALPPNYRTVLETPTFKIIRVHYGPHEKVAVHDHPDTPTVYVYLNNSSPVRISHEDAGEKPFDIIRPPTQKGAFRVSGGRLERHSIENLGDLESDFLRVELRDLRLGDKTLESRNAAPTSLAHNLDATEFSSPQLSVVRILCAENAPCTVPAQDANSVIVALSNCKVTGTSQGKPTSLALGAVMAVRPKDSLQVSPAGNEPAHLLQVIVHPGS